MNEFQIYLVSGAALVCMFGIWHEMSLIRKGCDRAEERAVKRTVEVKEKVTKWTSDLSDWVDVPAEPKP